MAPCDLVNQFNDVVDKIKSPGTRINAELELMHLIHQYPGVACFPIGLSTLLHHVCSTRCSLPVVKMVFEANRNAISTDYGNGYPLHEACRKEAPVEVIGFLAKVYPGACSYKNGDQTPLSLAIQRHSRRLHLLSMLSCGTALTTLGSMRLEWTHDYLFLVDGLKAYAHVYKPKSMEVRCVQGRTASSLSLSHCRETRTLLIDVWILSSLLEEMLLRIGSLGFAIKRLSLEFFEGMRDGVVRGIQSYSKLEQVDVMRCTSSDPRTMERFLDELTRKPLLKRLHMTRMSNCQDGTMFTKISKLTNLERLEISWTPVNADLGPPLRSLLQSSRNLKAIDISFTDVGPECIQKLANVLVEHKTVVWFLALGIPHVDPILLDVLQRGNCTLERVDCKDSYGAIQYYCSMNMSGRRRLLRRTDTTKPVVVEILASISSNLPVLYGLLRENPVSWSI